VPQAGIHAMLALSARKSFRRQPWFTLGLIFGSMLPDMDGYLQIVAMFVNQMTLRAAGTMYLRTITYSLFFAVGVMLLVLLIGWVRRWSHAPMFAAGLGIGMILLHNFIDIFFWFQGVGLLWPFWSVNIWSWLRLPAQIMHLLEAGEYFSFAAYYLYLSYLSSHNPVDRIYRVRLRQYTWLQIVLGVVFSLLAIASRPASFAMFNAFAFYIIAFPNALWITWRMRHTFTTSSRVARRRSTVESQIPIQNLDMP
jgi:hypothetical protein